MQNMANFNWVDYVVLGIFFISVLSGLVRGVIKELLSLVTWIVAFMLASVFAPRLAAMFTSTPQVQSAVTTLSGSGMSASAPVSMLAVGLCFLGIFIVVLIIGSLISSIVSGVADKVAGLLNRLLGAAFGLLRGFLINVLFMFLVQMTPLQQEAWWTQSMFVASFQPAVQWLSNLVQPGIASLKSKMGTSLDDVTNQFEGVVNSFGGQK